ncbi:MAG: ArsR family transcriptional regulator, partial [Candidatus Aenigmarchaeota archaeon]|nr:ArsR family transcriptional regulator [Candidatus Aenigmarchaeota archaeon]
YIVKKQEKDKEHFKVKKLDDSDIKALSANAIKILELLSRKEMYPKKIAQIINMNEQKVYYYIKNLKKAGLVHVVREETFGGLNAKYFSSSSDGAFVLWKKERARGREKEESVPLLNITKNLSNTIFVPGSPIHHGKQMAKAEDERLAILIALFMGSFSSSCSFNLANVKYDTQMTEDDLKKNLIIIGGPAINKIAALVNKNLAVRFLKKDDFYYCLHSKISGKEYAGENYGFVENITNPFNKYSDILVVGGRRSVGTEAAVFFLINHFGLFEEGNKYNKNIYSKIIKGFDQDNDGIVDMVEEIE